MNVLELFAGKRLIGKVCDQLKFNVFSVDWDDFENIDLVIDIEFLKIKDIPFIPDIIWASPDCTTYSIASISKHRDGIFPKTDYAKKCDRVNIHFINLIKDFIELNPNLIFYIENPRGMFRKMPFVQQFKRHTIWYCTYGDIRAKPTDIFTNSNKWKPKKECHNGNILCHHQKAPRGSKTGTQGVAGKKERSIIPYQLCYEILTTH